MGEGGRSEEKVGNLDGGEKTLTFKKLFYPQMKILQRISKKHVHNFLLSFILNEVKTFALIYIMFIR